MLFSMFMFRHRAASWEGRVILKFNQSLCVNVTSKEAKGCVAEAVPSCWLVSAAAPLGCLPAVRTLFLLGHEPLCGVAGQVLLVKPKSKIGSVRNLFWFLNLWVQAISEFVPSVLWVFSASFLGAKVVHFFLVEVEAVQHQRLFG